MLKLLQCKKGARVSQRISLQQESLVFQAERELCKHTGGVIHHHAFLFEQLSCPSALRLLHISLVSHFPESEWREQHAVKTDKTQPEGTEIDTKMAAMWPISLLCLIALALTTGAFAVNERQLPLVGGLREAGVNEEGVQKAMSFAMRKYNQASNDKYAMNVCRMIRARKQIVSGIKYFIDVDVCRTQCDISTSELTNCAFHQGSELEKTLTCQFVVRVIPWRKQSELESQECRQ
ncbi:cystatin [Microcaecilia unicolor]|uniref:Cystatin-like n=1 Tax=Microcaecilia unicolor TaxID=1415580 RepID=A0A6P7XWV6_9AMPH|nr:cystatin-like [Microcaecilia unicolor]